MLSIASDNDLPIASYWLGVMYENGFGTAREMEKAVALYRKAAEGGSDLATERLRRLQEL